jgi:hypothetical protein
LAFCLKPFLQAKAQVVVEKQVGVPVHVGNIDHASGEQRGRLAGTVWTAQLSRRIQCQKKAWPALMAYRARFAASDCIPLGA